MASHTLYFTLTDTKSEDDLARQQNGTFRRRMTLMPPKRNDMARHLSRRHMARPTMGEMLHHRNTTYSGRHGRPSGEQPKNREDQRTWEKESLMRDMAYHEQTLYLWLRQKPGMLLGMLIGAVLGTYLDSTNFKIDPNSVDKIHPKAEKKESSSPPS